MLDLLFIDTETGGLNPETDALLEIGLVRWKDGDVAVQTRCRVASEGLRVTPEALAVNGIDLARHEDTAPSRAWVVDVLDEWFACEYGAEKIRVAGHNVGFDLGFLRMLFGAKWMEQRFSHRTTDTASVLGFLADAGLVPADIRSLDKACAHFGIQRERAHRALDDAKAAAELYGRLLGMVRGRPSEQAEASRRSTATLVTGGHE